MGTRTPRGERVFFSHREGTPGTADTTCFFEGQGIVFIPFEGEEMIQNHLGGFCLCRIRLDTLPVAQGCVAGVGHRIDTQRQAGCELIGSVKGEQGVGAEVPEKVQGRALNFEGVRVVQFGQIFILFKVLLHGQLKNRR